MSAGDIVASFRLISGSLSPCSQSFWIDRIWSRCSRKYRVPGPANGGGTKRSRSYP
ncbi:hypothetical protein WMF17_23310 [Sorangium sp. So ce362]